MYNASGTSRNSVGRYYDEEPASVAGNISSRTASALHRLHAIKSNEAKQQERLSSIYKSLGNASSSTPRVPSIDIHDTSSRVSSALLAAHSSALHIDLDESITVNNDKEGLQPVAKLQQSAEIEKAILLSPENLD